MNPIRIHDSMTGQKQLLQPIIPGQVRMYVCGMTVYDYLHIGHARMLTVFDLVSRYLRYRGYKVTFVRNITDIDDKIIRRAAENQQPIESVTERFIQAMHEDCATLGLASPDFEPRATQYLPSIIDMIAQLVERGYAYQSPDGDVLYAVAKFEGYGRLSGKRLADLRAGARVEVDEGKRDPLDFVLWKHAKPGEPWWDSPWGRGRPGWHIECSAMATALLGTNFDLHGGGMDLKFPHHENEIAQSCAANGDRFANLWMHNGFVNIDDEKMSKSLGNFFTVREVLPRVRHPEVLRYFLLSSHYRGPINYSLEQLEQADGALTRIYTALRDVAVKSGAASGHTARLHEVMDDDFNTPEAIAVVQNLTRELNSAKAAGEAVRAATLAGELYALAGVLGLARAEPSEWFKMSKGSPTLGADAGHLSIAGRPATLTIGTSISEDEIDERIKARNAARQARHWAESDRIRDELAQAGIILEDKPGGGTTWRKA